ncbi:hypothetical protein [Azospirillum sp. SYSU D00513]|uniref:hypothetical protein n=1 Tax=Azospirillum sp. SYSU D00513 TaxID=2812561 RepID=UPI001A96CA66|nr:hypothetical protein [Azospirillum sp. SYSU D00513]
MIYLRRRFSESISILEMHTNERISSRAFFTLPPIKLKIKPSSFYMLRKCSLGSVLQRPHKAKNHSYQWHPSPMTDFLFLYVGIFISMAGTAVPTALPQSLGLEDDAFAAGLNREAKGKDASATSRNHERAYEWCGG